MEQDSNQINRRTFFTRLAGGAVGLLGAAGAFVAGGFLYPVTRREEKPLFICLESEVPDGVPMEIQDLMGRKVLLLRAADGNLITLSTVCTHLGCQVYYRPKRNVFECPCHQGFFDALGNPVSGPPQRPLERYPVVVRDGKVFVQFG